MGDAVLVRVNVSEVADVTNSILRTTVGLVRGVVVGSRGGAAVGQIAVLMNVKAPVSVRVQAPNLTRNFDGIALGVLRKVDGAIDVPSSLEHCDGVDRVVVGAASENWRGGRVDWRQQGRAHHTQQNEADGGLERESHGSSVLLRRGE